MSEPTPSSDDDDDMLDESPVLFVPALSESVQYVCIPQAELAALRAQVAEQTARWERAEAVLRDIAYQPQEPHHCRQCDAWIDVGQDHAPDCPVLVARTLLGEGVLGQMAAEALADDAAGLTRDLDELLGDGAGYAHE